MTPVETVLQVVREWLLAYASTSALTDKQVIAADSGGPRPPLPYLAVKVTSPGVEDGWVEQLDRLQAVTLLPTVTGRARRTAVVSVHGFGAATHDWLENALLALAADDDVRATLTALALPALGIQQDGPVQNVTTPLDTSQEPRFLVEVRVHYELTGAARVQVELARTEINHKQRAAGQPDRDTLLTQDF